jgi:RNA polymerase sigma-70 factor (ECF subfamily)
LKAAQNGDEAAWAAIYRDLAGPVTGYLRSHGVAEPDDVTAEVFLQMARDIHRFEGDDSSFRSWVFVIAHRRMIDQRRANGRRPKTTSSALFHEQEGGDVEDEALEQLTFEWVCEMLAELTPDQREVLALRIIADMSLEETAKTMGKTQGAIKALQRRGMAHLKVRLRDGGYRDDVS